MVGDPGGNGFACAGSVASSHEGMALFGGSRDAHRAGAFRRSTFGGRSRPRLRTIERAGEPRGLLHALRDHAELALGRLDDALRRSREEIAAECRWRGRALEITLGTHAAVLTRQGRCAEARLALAEFFEASRRTGWHRFGQFGNAFVELAFHEQRYSSAATLARLRARSRGGATDTQRRCAELLAALETVLDAETLERLLAKGEALDEEAVCALTLETGGCG